MTLVLKKVCLQVLDPGALEIIYHNALKGTAVVPEYNEKAEVRDTLRENLSNLRANDFLNRLYARVLIDALKGNLRKEWKVMRIKNSTCRVKQTPQEPTITRCNGKNGKILKPDLLIGVPKKVYDTLTCSKFDVYTTVCNTKTWKGFIMYASLHTFLERSKG